MITGDDWLRGLLRELWPWSDDANRSTSTRSRGMPEVEPIARQSTAEPTNKLSAGTTAAAGVGAVIAGALAGYGNEAIRDVLVELLPGMATKAATTNFIVFMLVTISAYVANKYAGLRAGYNVLDKPNVPLVPAPMSGVPVASAPRPVAGAQESVIVPTVIVPTVQTHPSTPTNQETKP